MSLHPTERETALVERLSRLYANRARGDAEREDIEQELWLWMVSHVPKVGEWRSDPQGARKLARTLHRTAARYVRVERAARRGYEPEDEYHYSIRMLQQLLPLAFDWPASVGPRVGTDDKVSHGQSDGKGLTVMVIDVRSALGVLKIEHRDSFELLRRVYASGVEASKVIHALAAERGTTYTPAAEFVRRAVTKVQALLGGPDIPADTMQASHEGAR